jgi:processive 1,2-diacylglycerol beta-glucosyltransferase
LLENGAAVKANSTATLAYKLDQLLANPERLRHIKENAARLGRPRAAFEIAEKVLGLADEYRAKHKSMETVGALA